MAEDIEVTRKRVYSDAEVISDRYVRVVHAVYGDTDILEIREFVPSVEAEGRDGYGRGFLFPRVPRTREALKVTIAGMQAALEDWPA